MPLIPEEERHIIKVVLIWTAVTLVLLGVAIGVLMVGLGMMASGAAGG